MAPKKPLPYPAGFENAESYVESLLSFITSSEMLQSLCGGVHILDFLTLEPDLYTTILPKDWRQWFLEFEISDILDLFMREDIHRLLSVIEDLPASDQSADRASTLHNGATWRGGPQPPSSLLQYISEVRRYTLDRSFHKNKENASVNERQPLSRQVTVGMKPKKSHEVENFAAYIDGLTIDISKNTSRHISHLVDFGSGQNYLGRALASPPYEKQVVALESKQLNIIGAKIMDVSANLAEKKKVRRNKKVYRAGLRPTGGESTGIPEYPVVQQSIPQTAQSLEDSEFENESRPLSSVVSHQDESSNNIQYVEYTIKDGDLATVVNRISQNGIRCGGSKVTSASTRCLEDSPTNREVQKTNSKSTGIFNNQAQRASSDTSYQELNLMVISLHSCGNLVHHGLRSLVLNPSVKAVAMVGCCYNLMTERLGPPTFKLPSLRPQHPRLDKTSSACDPHGFPMSRHLATYEYGKGEGIRLNITARMMAVQAPQNWTSETCEAFFTRHFYRALLQRIFLDRGVVEKPMIAADFVVGGSPRGRSGIGQAIIIGSLRKACYGSFTAYVRGAVEKLGKDELHEANIRTNMAGLPDEEIVQYENRYESKKHELSIIWSLMAFSAGVIESVIVVDRWLFLREQTSVKECWVEAVFDYRQSPRNLVVVGIKS